MVFRNNREARIWRRNIDSWVTVSSATLPSMHEIVFTKYIDSLLLMKEGARDLRLSWNEVRSVYLLSAYQPPGPPENIGSLA